MRYDDFLDLTPRTFWNALSGHYEAEQYKEQTTWERTRWLACQLLSPHVKQGRELTPKDLIEFPWEKEDKEVEIPTDDDLKRILERDKRILNGRT